MRAVKNIAHSWMYVINTANCDFQQICNKILEVNFPFLDEFMSPALSAHTQVSNLMIAVERAVKSSDIDSRQKCSGAVVMWLSIKSYAQTNESNMLPGQQGCTAASGRRQ